jgi:hypothetical protein
MRLWSRLVSISIVLVPACGSADDPSLPAAEIRDGAPVSDADARPVTIPSADAAPDGEAAVDDAAPDAEAEAASDAAEVGVPSLPPTSCGATLPGPPMRASLVEAQPGYATELAALDLSALPDPIDFTRESAIGREVANYMLERASGTTLSHADGRRLGGMGTAVLAAFAKGTDGGFDLRLLRRGLHHHYLCTRPVPGSLGALETLYGDLRAWPTTTIDCSKPKNGPRRLRENAARGVYLAETLVDGVVRETEAIFTKLRGDGQFDFAVYTETGDLTDRSTFATASGGTVTSAAPYTCMSCHVDAAAGTHAVLMPIGTGAGCR